MFFRLVLAFTVIPLIELALLIEIGRIIGSGPTIAIVLLTGVVGAALAQQQGLATIHRFRTEANAGRVPGEPLLDGLFVLVGGATLLTPGLLTDLIGFSLLLPATRRLWRRFIRRKLQIWAETGTVRLVWWK